jgi:hypothetical protein
MTLVIVGLEFRISYPAFYQTFQLCVFSKRLQKSREKFFSNTFHDLWDFQSSGVHNKIKLTVLDTGAT